MIRKISIKRQAQLDEYSKLRKAYLVAHQKCGCTDCDEKSTDVHHKRGRSGLQLNMVEDFLAVCRGCHTLIELNPAWAKAKGYSFSRLEIR